MTVKIKATKAQAKYGFFSMEMRLEHRRDESVIVFYNLKLVKGEKGICVYPVKKRNDEKAGYWLNLSDEVMKHIIEAMTARGWNPDKEDYRRGEEYKKDDYENEEIPF